MAPSNEEFVNRNSNPDEFPETRSHLLQQAAEGKWDCFMEQYLRPCWQHTMRMCRQQNIPVSDIEDLYQEFLVRIIRESKLKLPEVLDENFSFHGNIAAKYLKYRTFPLRSAKFRTVLKSLVKNVILEYLRDNQRRKWIVNQELVQSLEPMIENSASEGVDVQWITDSLTSAARIFRDECIHSSTQGKRRMFEIFWRSIGLGEKPGEMAQQFGLDRSTISELLKKARKRFVQILQEVSGIENIDLIKAKLNQQPELLVEAFSREFGR